MQVGGQAHCLKHRALEGAPGSLQNLLFSNVNNTSCLRLSPGADARALGASSWSPLHLVKQVHVLLIVRAPE